MPKKVRNAYDKMCEIPLLEQAILTAAKGKKKYAVVRKIVRDPETVTRYATILSEILKSGTFVPAPMTNKIIKTEYGKEREISKTPFFPDCCIHHAIALVMRDRWYKSLTCDTYACLRDRGINSKKRKYNMNRKIKRILAKYYNRRIFCLKMDISKCYPNVDNDILAEVYRRTCGDDRLLRLLDMFNYNHEGLPIGSFLSQLWINILLGRLDRYIKEELKIEHYFRYMDDIVILCEDKKKLHEWQRRIMNFCFYELHFMMNSKRQVFPVGITSIERGIDFGGYVFKRRHTNVRKRIKKSFARNRHNWKSVAAYNGILKYCDSINLVKNVLINDNGSMKLCDKVVPIERPFEGEKIKLECIVDRDIQLLDFEVMPSKKKPDTSYIKMQVLYDGRKRFIGGGYQYLAQILEQIDKSDLPLETKILNKNGYYFEGTIIE